MLKGVLCEPYAAPLTLTFFVVPERHGWHSTTSLPACRTGTAPREQGNCFGPTASFECARLDIYVRLDGLPEEQHLWQIEGLQTSRIEKKIGATRPYLNAIIGKTLHEARAILAEVKTFAGVQRAASSGAG